MGDMIQIVFDMDGVIFDTEALCQKAWRTVGEERGISIAEIDELLKLCIGSNQQHMTEVLREKLGEGRTYGIFSDYHRRGSGHTQQAGWRNLSEGVCCAWDRSVTDVWRGGFL